MHKLEHLSIFACLLTLVYLTGIHIRPKFHDHSCHEDLLQKLKHQLEKSMESIKQDELRHIKVPRKCATQIFFSTFRVRAPKIVSRLRNHLKLFEL